MSPDIDALIGASAAKYGEDPDFVRQVVGTESSGRNVPPSAGHSATGLMQIEPTTFGKYSNGNPMDPATNIDVGVHYLHDVRTGLTGHLGRPATNGETYLGYQQGPGGARALLANPDAPAASLVGASHVTTNGGTADMSARDFASRWTTHFDGGYAPKPVHFSDLGETPPVDAFTNSPQKPGESLTGLVGDLAADSMTADLLRSNGQDQFVPDANWAPTGDDLKKLATNDDGSVLPDEYMSQLAAANSEEHAKWIARQAWNEVDRRNRIASLGWFGQGAKLLSSVLDPANIGAAVATDGLFNPAEAALFGEASTLGRVARTGLVGAGTNLGLTALDAARHPGSTTENDYLDAAGMGLILGGAFGAIGRNPALKNEADALAHSGQKLREFANPETPAAPTEATVRAPRGASDFNAGSEAVGEPANNRAPPMTRVIPAPREFNVGDVAAGDAANDTARAQAFARRPSDFNVGSNVGQLPANAFLEPSDLIERYAQERNAELFGRVWDADEAVATARSRLEEALKVKAPPEVQTQLQALRSRFVTASGPTADRIAAEIRDLERQHPSTVGNVLGRDPIALRKALADALDDRRKIGPEVAKARAEAARFLGEREDGPLYPLTGFKPEDFGGESRGIGETHINELRAANDTTKPGERTEKAHKARNATPANDDYRYGPRHLPDPEMSLFHGPERPAILSAANDPWSTPPARPGGGNSVGAMEAPDRRIHMELNRGEWSDLAENPDTYKSNIRTKSAALSHFLLPSTGSQLASSPFTGSRIIAAHLADNPLGYVKDKNVLNAAMRKDVMRGQWLTHLYTGMKANFDKYLADNKVPVRGRAAAFKQFMESTFDRITRDDPAVEYHEGVRNFANSVRAVLRSVADRVNSSGLAGDEGIPYDSKYLPVMHDPEKVNDAYNKVGIGDETHLGLAHVALEAMKNQEWAKDMTPAQLFKTARAYMEGLAKRAADIDENWNKAWAGEDMDHLVSVLQNDGHMTADEARAIADTMERLTSKDRGGTKYIKKRLDLDRDATVNIPGYGPLSLNDLSEKNVNALVTRYIDQMSGRIGLAETHIVDPESGKVLMSGIKSDEDFEKLIREWKRTNHDNALLGAEGREAANLRHWQSTDEANLRAQYNQILSKGNDFNKTVLGTSLKIARKLGFDRMMGATGWSHMSIFAATLHGVGIRAAIEHMPMYRRMLNEHGEWILKHGLDRDIEAWFGNSTDPLMEWRMQGPSLSDKEYGSTPLDQRYDKLGKVDRFLGKTNQATAMVSGLSHIIDFNKRLAYKGILQKFATWAHAAKQLPDGTFDLSHMNMRRMLQLGLNEGDLQKVLSAVKQHATTDNGILFAHKLIKLNSQAWDQETAQLLQGAVKRFADRVVQHNDVGSTHRWMSNPAFQLMMQFRNFPIVGHTKQLMYNIAMHDPAALGYFLTTAAAGAMIYTARQKVNSIGRSDRDDYLSKTLSLPNLAHAAVYHSGFAGLMPGMIDSGLQMTGHAPWFNYRTTGNDMAFLSAPPAASWPADFGKAVGAVTGALSEHRPMAQSEVRTVARMFPWNNTLPMTLLMNHMVSGLPLKGPREPRAPQARAPNWLTQ